MARIYIDSQQYEVSDGQNLLQACLSLKLDLPYFCWHPSMGSVGACRQCAMTQYQDENDTRGRLIVACMTPVSDGMRVSMDQPAESEFRDQVISALMTHHPHDCPVCAEGGECHLQDMTVMAGHHSRHYQGKKTTFTNQNLGPLIKHEMNRCITCYRCVRFYQDYAGGTDLAAQASKNHVYFGRQCDGTLESEFAGNLVEVCPTGVFTDKPFGDHYSRKWDMQASPSICQHCSVGCNISLSERYGSVRRVTNRLNDHLNGYFLCDRGRFGFSFVNSADRCNEIRFKGVQVKWDDAGLQGMLNDSGRWIGIGSSQASLEDNFALQQFVSPENFCTSVDPVEEELLLTHCDILRQHSMANVAQIETADAVVIVAEDVNNSAPRIALAIRQALTNQAKAKAESLGVPSWQDAAVRQLLPHSPVPLIILGYGDSALMELATDKVICNERQATAMAMKLAHILDPQSCDVENEALPDTCTDSQLSQIIEKLKKAKRPLVIGGWSSRCAGTMKAAANLYSSLEQEEKLLALTGSEANSLSLGLLAQQGYLPSNQLPEIMDYEGCNLLVLDHSGALFKQKLDRLHPKARNLVRLSQLGQQKDDEANLPVTAFSECSGSTVNYQGLVQNFYPATKSTGQCLPAWQWLVNIAKQHSMPLGKVTNLDELREAMCMKHDSLNGQWRRHEASYLTGQFAMQPPRYSGRTAMLANQTVHEPKPFGEDNAPYKQSMEGRLSGLDKQAPQPYSWSPGWNSNQSNHKFKGEYRGISLSVQQGVHVIKPNQSAQRYAFSDLKWPETSSSLQLLRLYKVFGSDSLSLFSLPIQQLSCQAQVHLNPEIAESLGLERGQLVCCGDDTTIMSVNISETVPKDRVLVYVPADHLFDIDQCESIVAATEEQISLLDELQKLRGKHIDEHQRIQKERLLRQDQTIPIHFIEGVSDA